MKIQFSIMYPDFGKNNECRLMKNIMTVISKSRKKNLTLFTDVSLSERSVYKQISQEFTFPTTKNNFSLHISLRSPHSILYFICLY